MAVGWQRLYKARRSWIWDHQQISIYWQVNPETSRVQPPWPKRTSQEEWIRIRNPVRGKHGSSADAHELDAERDWVESLALSHLFFSTVRRLMYVHTKSSCSSTSFNVHRNCFHRRLLGRLRLCRRRKFSLKKFHFSQNILQFPSSRLSNMASGWTFFFPVRPCSSERLDERPRKRLEGR